MVGSEIRPVRRTFSVKSLIDLKETLSANFPIKKNNKLVKSTKGHNQISF